ncbi:hypothetical protein GCM10010123_01150 [Pilimelia anulata]|uniref:Glyoxalase-like domain-containing protein n=1 Tax=Pilimelia anulata TaxID=53371 RepID=A0A8J3B2A9_9ACTN|nr:VOC family protein [Pilimelia anulata]GGJ74956.1 hypothetical protein GCM10010123_01150 [Pilimelia anulata]
MSRRCSHVLVRVADLARAVADYRALGFDVRYATDPATAQHAHVWFADGPIIELLTTPASARHMRLPIDLVGGRGSGRRMVRWAVQDEGLCDVAVVDEAAPLGEVIAGLRAAGVPVGRQWRWRRRRPDGDVVRFAFAYPRADRVPFLVSPYRPPQRPADVAHANGATGIAAVHVDVHSADAAAFDRITGGDPVFDVRPAQRTAVTAVTIAGWPGATDAALLHGAALRAGAAA